MIFLLNKIHTTSVHTLPNFPFVEVLITVKKPLDFLKTIKIFPAAVAKFSNKFSAEVEIEKQLKTNRKFEFLSV